MMRSISTTCGRPWWQAILTVVVLFTQLNLAALFSGHQAGASPCEGGLNKSYFPHIPISNAMSQPSNTENLEAIIRKDAAFPYDGLITQVFATTVNVMPVGSRTVLRDVALPAHIDSKEVQIGYAVRLDQTAAKPTVLAIFEQFADPEMFNYAGKGVKVPATPNVTVKATKTGWLVTWNAISGATKYILYKNDTPDGTSPEEVIQLGSGTTSYTVAYEEPFIYYAVKACSGYLESDVSLWMTDMTPPDAPTWKAHAYQSGGHYIEWTHAVPADVKEFIVYCNESPADLGATEVTRTANLNTIIPYLDSNDYFGVQAVDWSGRNKSAIVWTVEYDPTPATPTNILANMTEGGGFILTWTAPAKAIRYEVEGYVDQGETSYWTNVYTGPGTMTPVIRLSNVYSFRVRAIGWDNSTSAWSATVTDNNPPPKPIIDVVNGVQQITVSLAVNDTSHNSLGFSHYIIQVSDSSNGSSPTIADDHALYPSFPHVVAQAAGTTKYYSLIPVDWAGNQGPASNWLPAYSFTLDGAPNIQDKFDTYGGTALTPIDSLYWLSLAKVEQSESWTFLPVNKASWVSTDLAEGSKAIRALSSDPGLGTTLRIAKAMNLTQEGRFTNNDYLVIQNRVADIGYQKVTITFYNTTGYPNGSGYKRTFDTTIDFGSPFVAKRSQFVAYGPSPNWATINGMEIFIENFDLMGGMDITIDDIRIVKADPEDATTYNDTGLAWDYARSSDDTYGPWEWHIYPGNRTGEPFKPFSFGQVNTAYGTPDQWYLAHKPIGTDVVVGTIQAGIFHKENGQNGLAFYIKDVSVNHWTMYAIETDNVGDTVKLVKWVDGVRTELGSAAFPFISAAGGTTGQTIWVGADFSDYDSDNGRIKVYASTIEGNLIQANNLKISIQDTSVGSGGSVGLLSYQSNVRFVNFTAGSPAHAEVADVAKALDGPIVADAGRRVHYNKLLNRFEYTDDGTTFSPVSGVAGANLLSPEGGVTGVAVVETEGSPQVEVYMPLASSQNITAPNLVYKTSTNRPGVTKLYRRESDMSYNVQTDYVAAADGTSRWRLRGYNGDTFHQECFTAYANVANVAAYLGNTSNPLTSLKATGAIVYRSTDITGVSSGYYPVPFSAYYQNTMSGWDSSTMLYAQRTGWHFAFCGCGIAPTTNTSNLAICLVYNGNYYQYQQERRGANTNAVNFNIGAFIYMTSGQYVQMQAYCEVAYTVLHTFSTCKLGLLSLDLA